jgi:hypothetical protein
MVRLKTLLNFVTDVAFKIEVYFWGVKQCCLQSRRIHYLLTKLHGVTSQGTVIFTVTAVRSSDLTMCYVFPFVTTQALPSLTMTGQFGKPN